MAAIRRIVIDVLLPHNPPILSFTDRMSDVESVAAVNASLIELDREVQNIKLTFEGQDLDFATIESEIEQAGGTVHSVDQVVSGEYIVEDRRTLQDN